MIVAIDIGNSDIVMGIHLENSWKHVWRISSNLEMISAEYEIRLRHFFLENQIASSDVNGLILSSVVPLLTPTIVELCEKFFGESPVIITPEIIKRLPIQVNNPHEIGSDLVANAMAAYARVGKAVIVVDFGTALTFTSISNNGEILGVAIAPGVKTAMKSLSTNTAKLPEIPLEIPESVIGLDTVTALQAGIMQGYVGLVRHMIDQTKKEMQGDPKVLATGGLSFIFKPVHDSIDEILPYLTLDGLLAIKNAQEHTL